MLVNFRVETLPRRRTEEEDLIYEAIDQLHRQHQAALKPLVDRLVEIDSMHPRQVMLVPVHGSEEERR